MNLQPWYYLFWTKHNFDAKIEISKWKNRNRNKRSKVYLNLIFLWQMKISDEPLSQRKSEHFDMHNPVVLKNFEINSKINCLMMHLKFPSRRKLRIFSMFQDFKVFKIFRFNSKLFLYLTSIDCWSKNKKVWLYQPFQGQSQTENLFERP